MCCVTAEAIKHRVAWLVIPASRRRALGFEEGDAVVASQELGRLLLEKPEQIKQRLKQW